jgi:drug/metabolite transporter (DMT)-like permease
MSRHRRAMVSVVLAALLWSTSFAVTKVVLPQVGELSLGAARFLVAAALLLLVCLLGRQSLRASLAQHFRTAVAGVIGITIYFTLENFGVAYATASDATLIVASYPVLMMVAEAGLKRARLRALNVFGAVVAVIGVGFVISDHPADPAPHRLWGIGLLLVGGVAWTAYNLVTKQRGALLPARRLGVVPTTFLQNLWGGLGFCVLLPLLPQSPATDGLDNHSAFLIGYLAVGCSAAAFLLYTYGLGSLTASQAVGLLNLVPMFGLLFAVLIAGESLTYIKIVGAVIIIAGVALNVSTPPQRLTTKTQQPAFATKESR